MVAYMKRFGTAFARARELTRAPEFGQLTIASFKWSMGPVADEHSSLESWLFENPIHHIDLARYYCGELDSWQAQLARNTADEFAVAVSARAADGGVVSMQLSTTGSWEQHNERVELQGTGASAVVDNVDTCISRTGTQPDLVWRPNYTIPTEENSSAATGGFLGELQAFASAIETGKPPPSDFRSAATDARGRRSPGAEHRTMRLTCSSLSLYQRTARRGDPDDRRARLSRARPGRHSHAAAAASGRRDPRSG